MITLRKSQRGICKKLVLFIRYIVIYLSGNSYEQYRNLGFRQNKKYFKEII